MPLKLLIERRESIALFVRYFGHSLDLRRNNPRIIPEAGTLAAFALENCGLPRDAIMDDTSAPYPHDDEFELDELETEGYASLLRIERGRLRNRDVFGPIRLHYGFFQLRARHSHYLIARRENQIAGGIGFMVDEIERVVRVFELIAQRFADSVLTEFILGEMPNGASCRLCRGRCQRVFASHATHFARA